MRIALIGNGVASFTLIRELSKYKGNFDIDVFTQEVHPFYWRPRLIEVLANETMLEDITPHNKKWYEERNTVLHLQEKVVKVDFEKKHLYTSKNESYEYDILVIASGAKPFLPPVKGNNLKGVYTIRTYEDVATLKENYDKVDNFVVIGGGVLGLETAAALKRAKQKSVTVVEHSAHLLSRQLDVLGGQVFEEAFRKRYGVKFMVLKSVSEIKGNERVESVLFSDGTEIKADVVIFSTGVRANVEFLEESPLKIERGIVVGDLLETNLKDVYALGDVAQHNGILSGTMPPAVEEAKVLARVLNGELASYKGTIRSNILKIAGLEVVSVGNVLSLSEEDIFSCQGDLKRGIYKKVVANNGKFIGAIGIGIEKKVALSMKKMVENGEKPNFPLYEYTKLEEGEL